MEINWITIIAQIVNFLILVWLLQRFLYKPIVRAMAAREEKIRTRLEEAAATRQEAEAERDKLQQAQEALEAERDSLLAAARAEAERARAALEQEAREEVERRAAGWQRQLDDERAAFIADLRRRSIERFYALAREALGGLADASLNEAMIEQFLARLDELEGDGLERLQKAAGSGETRLRVESSFELDPVTKRRVTTAIHKTVAEHAEIDYRLADDLICGIRLKAGGQTVGWSLAGYLDRLERRALADLGDASTAPRQAAE